MFLVSRFDRFAVPVTRFKRLGFTGLSRSQLSRSAVSRTFATSLSIQGFNIVTGVLLARTLGPSGRGTLAAILLWPMLLAAVGSLGLPEAVTYYTSRAVTQGGKLLGTVLTLVVALSALLICLGLVLEPLVLRHADSHSVELGRLFLAFIPLNLATLAAMGVLNGLQRYGWFNIIRFLVIALTACGLLLIGALGVLTLTSAVVVYLSANVVSLVVALVAAIRSVSGPIRFVPALTRPLLGFGLKSHLASVSSVANERGDQLLISAFLAPQLLGLYVVAVTLTSLTNLVGGSVEVVALSRIAGERNADRQRAAARRYISRTLLGSAVISVALIAVTPQLIDIFFGSNFGDATPAARILLVAAVILSTNRVLGAVLKGLGRPLEAGIGETIALAATVFALPILLWRVGIVGAASASLLAYTTSFLWNATRCGRALNLTPRTLLLWGSRGGLERRDLSQAAPIGGGDS